MVEVSTSILSVKEEDSIRTFYNLETAKTDYFHIDVMDGKFVENDTQEKMMTYAKNLKQITTLPLDIHLMVQNVAALLEEYIPLQPSNITFHLEAGKQEEVKKWIQTIKENGIKVGLAIKPHTPVESILEFLPYVHVVLVMTVEPGKGGQKLLDFTLDKIQQLDHYRQEQQLDYAIEADGGINLETKDAVVKAGADILVVGSSMIQAKDFAEEMKKIKQDT